MASFRSLTHFLLTITVFLLTSCNDDVFIDRPDLTGDVGVTIMEPHEIKNVSYEQTGLSTITVEVEREASFTVVGKDDSEILTVNGTAIELEAESTSRIEVDATQLTLTVCFFKGQIEIFSTRNISLEAFKAELRLDYGNRRRNIAITVSPGELLKVSGYAFPSNKDIRFTTVTKERETLTFRNDTEEYQRVTIDPFDGLSCLVDLVFDDGTDRMIDMASAPDVAVLSADDSPFFSDRYVRLSPGRQETEPFFKWTQTFRVPPHSTYRFTTTVVYSIVDSEIGIICSLASDEWEQTVIKTAMHVEDPIDFTISYEKID